MKSIQDIREEARKAIIELIDAARLTPGQLVIVGCSSSEMAGGVIGHDSHMELVKNPFWPGTDAVPQPMLDGVHYSLIGANNLLEQNPGYEKDGFIFGRVVEWSMAPASKVGGPFGPVGSNPTPSAKNGFSLALPT